MASSLGNRVSKSGASLADDQRVLDADTAAVGQIDTGLHGDRRASKQCTGGRRADSRRFVDLQSDAVAESVAEVVGVPGVGDDLPRRGVDLLERGPGRERFPARPLRGGHQLVDVELPLRGRRQHERAGHVGVIAAHQGAEVDLDEVAGRQHRVGGPVVRDRRVGPGRHDGLERHAVGAVVEHQRLEFAAHLFLCPARPQPAALDQVVSAPRRPPRTPAAAARSRPHP